ncbi:LBN protein, partial [Polypterus senegalus]
MSTKRHFTIEKAEKHYEANDAYKHIHKYSYCETTHGVNRFQVLQETKEDLDWKIGAPMAAVVKWLETRGASASCLQDTAVQVGEAWAVEERGGRSGCDMISAACQVARPLHTTPVWTDAVAEERVERQLVDVGCQTTPSPLPAPVSRSSKGVQAAQGLPSSHKGTQTITAPQRKRRTRTKRSGIPDKVQRKPDSVTVQEGYTAEGRTPYKPSPECSKGQEFPACFCSRKGRAGGGRLCYSCGHAGHVWRGCPRRTSEWQGRRGSTLRPVHYVFTGRSHEAKDADSLSWRGPALAGQADEPHKPHLRKKRKIVNNEVDPEYAVYNINETSKEEAAFEDKIIDIFLYEDPQNMYEALENLDMSSLLHTSAKLESYRVLIYKDLIAKLLRNLKITSEFSPAAEKRLKSVLNGQLMGMEGKLKEEHVARMAALAAEFNLETREEMEREHRKVAREKEKAEQLFKHMNQQMALECNVLLDTLHKFDQRHLQHSLLVRHEEASAKVQRQIMVFRRVELHKIFFEEVEEMTKMGELEKNVAKKLLHIYLSRQEQLEELLDILLANQRSILGERHAHRQYLVHSLQSLRNLVYDVFTKATAQVESVFEDLNNEGFLPEDMGEPLFEKTTNNLLQVKQKFEEALSREKKTLHCNLIKKRRNQICEKLQEQYQKRQELSVIHKTSRECQDLVDYLNCWQKLLLLQYVELGDLINNLDEEAAADIRKVIMRLLQSAITEIKGIQPKISQELLSLGLPRHAVQNIGLKHELITGALPEAQEKLHKEGKIAVKVLQKTRETLQNHLDVEVKEQQDLRMREKSIFKNLSKAQLTLSEDDLLKMKLEFQNCFSQMDKCLVLPKAQARSRLQTYLSEWRREMLRNMEHSQSEIHGKQVLVEILYERANYLKAQEEGLAVHITALQLQKAEKRVRTLETYVAILNVQSLLVEELRISGSMTGPSLVEMIHKHIQGLEEADRLVHLKELAWWNALKKDQSMAASREEDFPTDYNSHEESQIASILEQAFTKRQQIMDIEKRRLMNEHTSSQTTEDFKEQLEFKKLQAYFDQDLALIADFVKQAQIPANILLEVLRLLLPTSLENDLISILDAICSRPTQATQFNGIDKGKLETSRKPMHIKLKEEITKKYAKPGNLGKEKGSILKKKQGLLLKQVSFPHLENPYNLKEHSVSENHITAVESTTETLNVSDTKEVFIFRPKVEQEESLQKSVKKKKKKRNFLNLKKAAVANMDIP